MCDGTRRRKEKGNGVGKREEGKRKGNGIKMGNENGTEKVKKLKTWKKRKVEEEMERNGETRE